MLTQKIKILINKKHYSAKREKSMIFQMAKLLIFIILAYYLYITVETKLSDANFLETLKSTITKFRLLFLLPIALFFVNWSVEALKWQFVVSKIEKITFYKAIKGTLTGVALSTITPIGIGDYIGRILQLENESRFKAIGAVLIANLCQLYVTILWGSLSFWVIFPNPFEIEQLWLSIIWWSLPFINLLFLLMFSFKASILPKIKKNSWLNSIYECFEVLTIYKYEELLYLFFLSLFRYFIFTIQFVMVLYFFNVSKDLTLLLLGVNFIFLLKTIIPTLFDFGVRETAAVFFFGMYGCDEKLVLLASLSLWFINIILPALIGLFFILKLKTFPKA